MAETNIPLLSNLIREFGFGLYDAQRTQGEMKEMLLSVQDRFGWAKPALESGWKIVSTWERLEPSEARAPLPYVVFRALLSAALGWRWFQTALALFVSFHCLLRPGELYELRRSDVLMEGDENSSLIIRIAKGKRWVRGARGQYAKLEGRYVSDWVRRLLQSMPASASCLAGGAGGIRLALETSAEGSARRGGPVHTG